MEPKRKKQTAFRLSDEKVTMLREAAELDNRGNMTAALEEAIERYYKHVVRTKKEKAAA